MEIAIRGPTRLSFAAAGELNLTVRLTAQATLIVTRLVRLA